jgi:hypothetical protein
MRTFLLYAAILTGTVAMAQAQSFQSQQWTTGVVGLTPGLTARLNILYPRVPAPILQVLCSATVAIEDDQGGILKFMDIPQLVAGKSVALDLNADTDLAGQPRTQIHANSVSPGCRLVTTLELIDNATQRTLLVVGGESTYPFAYVGPFADVAPAMIRQR